MTSDDVDQAVRRLRQIHPGRLRALVGRETVQLFGQVLREPPGHAELCRLLVRREGPNLLAQRPTRQGSRFASVRGELLDLHDDSFLRRLLGQIKGRTVRTRTREKLLHQLAFLPWFRGSQAAHAMTAALGLPVIFAGDTADGLPPTREYIEGMPPHNRLFPYQQEVVEALTAILRKDQRVMLSSYTGTGKTRMGMEVLCRLIGEGDRSVVWVAQKTELLEQAVATLKRLWPHLGGAGGVNVLRFFGGNDLPDGLAAWRGLTVVFAGSQQLALRLGARDEGLRSLLERTDLLVVDEAHFALAEGHRELLSAYESARGPSHRVLGLSATPGRSDLVSARESEQLAQLFQGHLVIPRVPAEQPLEWFQRRGYLARIDHQRHHLKSSLTGRLRREAQECEDFSLELLERLGRDRKRNLQILKVIRSVVKAGRRPLVFCCSIGEALMLRDLLLLNGIAAGAVYGEMDVRDRRGLLDSFRQGRLQVMLNVEVLTTGFDAPLIDTLILCRPTYSGILYEQMVGRGLRGPKVGGTRRCLIVDFTENFARFDRPLAWQRWLEAWPQSRLEGISSSAPDQWRVSSA